MPWYLGNSSGFTERWWGAPIALLAVWSVLWTGFALWNAARRGEKGWFIFFLIVHTAGIVEFLYLLFVAKAFGKSSSKSSPPRRSRRK